MANECEGNSESTENQLPVGSPLGSIEITTCSHIPLPRRLSASAYGPVGKQCDTGPLANQTSLISPLWLFLSPRPLSLKLHLAQSYLIKELSPLSPVSPTPTLQPSHPPLIFSPRVEEHFFLCLLIASAAHRLLRGPVVFTPRHCNLPMSPSCASAAYLGGPN